ncbi:MAG: hypothetical protein ACI39N_06875 [Lachnospiraceae bacterium]
MDYSDGTLYYTPRNCKSCGEAMEYRGLGEYVCEKCDIREFDDYGKVRNYIETHRGATAIEIEQETGVPKRVIRQLLREERIAVSKDSKIFLKCESCGCDILAGHYCAKCGADIRKNSMLMKEPSRKNISGFGRVDKNNDGEFRFRKNYDR